MINYFRVFILILLTGTSLGVFAQNTATTSSPYSQFGLGDYDDPLLPQNRGMGGIGVALRKPSAYFDINTVNPASYSAISLTTIDIGAYAGISGLSNASYNPQYSSNFRLSHLNFAVPVSKKSALSFGLLPYTNLGYSYSQTAKVNIQHSPDTITTANYLYSGDGGLSKAYIGYGFGLGKHLNLGMNVAFIFGNEKIFRSTQFPDLITALNTQTENSFSVGGLNYDLGAQYSFDLSESRHIILGYSVSAGSKLNTTSTYVVSHYTLSTDGTQKLPTDSTSYTKTDGKIVLPVFNRFGISYQSDNHFVIGADYKMGSWSDLSIQGVNSGLQNNQSLSVGTQITPNINALSSYLAVIDYRFGFNYDKTYLKLNGTDITQYAATFGLGLPIRSESRSSFYKVNFSAEIGKRGTIDNNLIKETFFNFHLGFTINDRWFQKYKFD